jgi:hypothetical protein
VNGDVSLPPTPIITQWNSCLEAVVYHSQHISHYAGFIELEKGDVGSTVELEKLAKMLKGEKLVELRQELNFIASHSDRIMKTLTAFEGHVFLVKDVYNTVSDLLAWLQTPGTLFPTPNCENAMKKAAEKFSQYIYGDKHPGIHALKAIRVFDPHQMPLLSNNNHDHFLGLSCLSTASSEWAIYLSICGEQGRQTEDVAAFWSAVRGRLPTLSSSARRNVSCPTCGKCRC